jgi:hypothetical protein
MLGHPHDQLPSVSAVNPNEPQLFTSPLRGLNFVLGLMRIPLKRWPVHHLSVPIGLELYLKEEHTQKLGVPFRSRSQLGRDILDFAAAQLPERQLRSLADGVIQPRSLSTSFPIRLRQADASRLVPSSMNYFNRQKKRVVVRRKKKGDLIGSLKTLAETNAGWWPHPSAAGAEIQAWYGLWHSVLSGRLIRIVCSGVIPSA